MKVHIPKLSLRTKWRNLKRLPRRFAPRNDNFLWTFTIIKITVASAFIADDGGPEKIMRITFDIDAELIERVVKTTGARSKKKAIEIAMKEFLRARRQKELSDLIGDYEGFEVTLKDLRKMRKDS